MKELRLDPDSFRLVTQDRKSTNFWLVNHAVHCMEKYGFSQREWLDFKSVRDVAKHMGISEFALECIAEFAWRRIHGASR